MIIEKQVKKLYVLCDNCGDYLDDSGYSISFDSEDGIKEMFATLDQYDMNGWKYTDGKHICGECAMFYQPYDANDDVQEAPLNHGYQLREMWEGFNFVAWFVIIMEDIIIRFSCGVMRVDRIYAVKFHPVAMRTVPAGDN